MVTRNSVPQDFTERVFVRTPGRPWRSECMQSRNVDLETRDLEDWFCIKRGGFPNSRAVCVHILDWLPQQQETPKRAQWMFLWSSHALLVISCFSCRLMLVLLSRFFYHARQVLSHRWGTLWLPGASLVQGVTDRIFAFRISILHWRPGELTILRGAVEAPRRYIYIYIYIYIYGGG